MFVPWAAYSLLCEWNVNASEGEGWAGWDSTCGYFEEHNNGGECACSTKNEWHCPHQTDMKGDGAGVAERKKLFWF